VIGSLRSWVVHPFLLAMYPILALFAQNAREVRAVELGALLGWAVSGSLAAWLLLALLLRDARKAGLVVSLGVVLFFTLGWVVAISEPAIDYLDTFWVGNLHGALDPRWVVLVEALLLGWFAFRVLPRFQDLSGLTAFLNLFAILVIAIPIVQAATIKAPAVGRPPRRPVPFALGTPPPRSSLPDIYYIILDGYARTDVMKALFDFDNSAFLERLERKGFYIARRSTANYCQTPLCLSASLNGVYLDDLVKGLGPDQTQLTDLIGQNNVLATLRPLGYRFVSFSTGFDPTEHPEADRYLSPYPFSTGFQRMVLDTTPLRILWPNPDQFDQFTQGRQRILYLLDHLPDVARDPAPTFTLAHLLCPHLPFLFGENGEDVAIRHQAYVLGDRDKNPEGHFRDPDRFRRAYRSQSAYITKRIEQTLDRLLAASPEPPIIILQSDHGSELGLHVVDVNRTDHKERMSILNAYYFPGRRYQGLYDRISPVNSFRVVLNTFFGAHLELLPDRSYYSSWPEPYKFHDVTALVRSPDAG